MNCYFEDQTEERIEEIINWFYRARTGRLVFDDRPFVYYTATVSSILEGSLYNTKDATLTIKMEAFDPFGKMLYKDLDSADSEKAQKTTGMVYREQMPKISTKPGEYLLYNPGTEMADTIIRIAGTAPNGVLIENRTTGEICRIVSLPSSPDELVLDSEEGDVYLMSNADGHNFEFHDEGFIRLAPCVPYQRSITVSFASGSNVVAFVAGAITQDNIGQYLLINSQWYRIIAVKDDTSAVINKHLEADGQAICMLATMNEISVQADDAEFTTLEIDYIPRTR